MREFGVDQAGDGMRLDRYLKRIAPGLPTSLAQKYLRLKKIKLNGKPAKPDARVAVGDALQLFIEDACFDAPRREDALLGGFKHHIRAVYEDEQVLLVDKKPGLIVHPDEAEKVNTLVTHARAYLYQRGEYDSMAPGAFAPTPVNRIDRFTGGLVLFAKTREALDRLNLAFRDGEVEKDYLLIAHGMIEPPDGLIDNYLKMAPNGKKAIVLPRAEQGAKRAMTAYRTLAVNGALSLVECRLLTGRTHQIRAQFAAAGHPLLGDAQYGDARRDARYGRSIQALCAFRVTFRFHDDGGALASLQNQSFETRPAPFVRAFFPEVDLRRD